MNLADQILESEPGAYLHYCEFSDGILIDETMTQFLDCRCYQPDPVMLAAQDSIAVRLDAARELHQ